MAVLSSSPSSPRHWYTPSSPRSGDNILRTRRTHTLQIHVAESSIQPKAAQFYSFKING